MLTIPHRKIKSHADTLTFLLDPARLKSSSWISVLTSGALSNYFKRKGTRMIPGTVFTAACMTDQNQCCSGGSITSAMVVDLTGRALGR